MASLRLHLVLSLSLAVAMRVTEHEDQRRNWLDKLPMKLHSGAHLTALPKLPKVWSDRFRLDKKLGEGGNGAVYEAKVQCGSTWSAPPSVSVKLVRDANATMHQEVERMQQHSSQYVIHTLGTPDTAKTSDGEWVMMPFLNGGSLKDLLRKCSYNKDCLCTGSNCRCQGKETHFACYEALPGMSLPYVLALFDEVLEGLEAIHSLGLAHMDMKPDNIMLHCSGDSCYALVIDLGTLCNSSIPLEKVQGTPGYVAPEVYPQMGTHPGLPSNDVWAMGFTLYQLLYQDYPEFVDGPFNRKSLEAQIKYIPSNDRNIPKNRTELDDLVVDMMDTNYTTRITLPEVRKRLRSFIESQEPKQEVLDMLHKSPSDRGLADNLPDCVDTPTPKEMNAEEDEEEEKKGVDIGDLLGDLGAHDVGETIDDQPCFSEPVQAEGWFDCGVCNLMFCQRCCMCGVRFQGSIKTKYFRAKSCPKM